MGGSEIVGRRVAIVGIGNLLLRDEGVGIHVVQELRQRVLPASIVLVDGGTSPEALSWVGQVDKIVLIDAVNGGGEPGSVYRLSPDDVGRCEGQPLSLHQWSLADTLGCSAGLAEETEVTIIGIEPAETGWGLELSPQLTAAMPRIIEVVLDEAGRVPV